MRKSSLPLRLLSHDTLTTLFADTSYADMTAFYLAVGEGRLSATTVVQRLLQSHGGSEGATEDLAETVAPPGPVPCGAGARRAIPASSSTVTTTSGSSSRSAVHPCQVMRSRVS